MSKLNILVQYYKAFSQAMEENISKTPQQDLDDMLNCP